MHQNSSAVNRTVTRRSRAAMSTPAIRVKGGIHDGVALGSKSPLGVQSATSAAICRSERSPEADIEPAISGAQLLCDTFFARMERGGGPSMFTPTNMGMRRDRDCTVEKCSYLSSKPEPPLRSSRTSSCRLPIGFGKGSPSQPKLCFDCRSARASGLVTSTLRFRGRPLVASITS